MNCFNFHSKCNAGCCSDLTPLPDSLITTHADKMQRQSIQKIEAGDSPFGEGISYALKTEDNRCVFLKADYSCAVYDERPIVCQKFGDESHPYLTCTVQSKDGRSRSRQESRRIIREDNKYTNRFNVFISKNTKRVSNG